MIAKLQGLVDEVGTDFAIIDVGGVGYLVQASGRTLGRLVSGQVASLLIETKMSEEKIQLIGFFDRAERDWFKLLTTVQGVGARVALAILTALTPQEVTQAIALQDKTALSRANGVGAKLAGRIAAELKDKVGSLSLGDDKAALVAAGAAAQEGGALADAVSALVNLGYKRPEALTAVAAAQRRVGQDAAIDALIREGLRELAS